MGDVRLLSGGLAPSRLGLCAPDTRGHPCPSLLSPSPLTHSPSLPPFPCLCPEGRNQRLAWAGGKANTCHHTYAHVCHHTTGPPHPQPQRGGSCLRLLIRNCGKRLSVRVFPNLEGRSFHRETLLSKRTREQQRGFLCSDCWCLLPRRQWEGGTEWPRTPGNRTKQPPPGPSTQTSSAPKESRSPSSPCHGFVENSEMLGCTF